MNEAYLRTYCEDKNILAKNSSMASSWEDDSTKQASICEDDLEENYYSVLNIPLNVFIDSHFI